MNFDGDGLSNNVIPKIKQVRENLNSARSYISAIVIPSGYSGTFKTSCIKSIDNAVKSTQTNENAIQKNIRDFEHIEQQNKQMAGKIQVASTNVKTEAVKKSSNTPAQTFADTYANIEQNKAQESMAIAEEVKKIAASAGNLAIRGVKSIGKFFENVWDAALEGGGYATANQIANTNLTMDTVAGLTGMENVPVMTADEVGDIRKEIREFTATEIAVDHVGTIYEEFYETTAGKKLDEAAYSPFEHDGVATEVVGSVADGVVVTAAAIVLPGGEFYVPFMDSYGRNMEQNYKGLQATSEATGEYWITDENLANANMKALEYAGIDQALYAVGAKVDTLKIASKPIASAALRVSANTIVAAADTPLKAAADAAVDGKSYDVAFNDLGGWKTVGTTAAFGFGAASVGEFKIWLDSKNAAKVSESAIAEFSGALDDGELRKVAANYTDTARVGEIYRSGNRYYDVDGMYWYVDKATGQRIEPFSQEYYKYLANDQRGLLQKQAGNDYARLKNALMESNGLTAEQASAQIEAYMLRCKEGLNIYWEDTNFRALQADGNTYGANQGVFGEMVGIVDVSNGRTYQSVNQALSLGADMANLKKYANTEYMNYKNLFIEKYNMSNADAACLMTGLDSLGACSYATTVDSIYRSFEGNELAFKEVFGFDMYKYAADGTKKSNYAELLTDLYYFANHVDNGGFLISTDASGRNIVAKNLEYERIRLNQFSDQQYAMRMTGQDTELINNYLNSKGSNLKMMKETIFDYNERTITSQDLVDIKNNIYSSLANGEQVNLTLGKTGSAVRFIDMDNNKRVFTSTFDWNEHDGHAMHVTGIAEEGLIVNSWGKRMLLPWNDIQNAGGIGLYTTTIEEKTITDKIAYGLSSLFGLNKKPGAGKSALNQVSMEDTRVKSVAAASSSKMQLNEDTIIKYNNGLEDRQISYKQVKDFLDTEVEFSNKNGMDIASLKNTDYKFSNNYFNKNETTPNEMATAVLSMLKNYDLGADTSKAESFVAKYYSSLDSKSIQLDNWAHSGLIDEMIESNGDYIFKNLDNAEKVNALKQRMDGENTVNFFKGEDFDLIAGIGEGQNYAGTSLVNVDACDRFSDATKQSWVENSKNHLSLEELEEKHIKDVVYHETMHGLSTSADGAYSGLYDVKEGSNLGITEAMTELFSVNRENSLFKETGQLTAQYQFGMGTLGYMNNNDILKVSDMKNVYFNNDLEGLKNILKMGNAQYEGLTDTEVSAFLKNMDNATTSILNKRGPASYADEIKNMFNGKSKYYEKVGG